MILESTSGMRAYKTALWTGFLYMWVLFLGGIALKDRKPDDGYALGLALTAFLVVPLVLSIAFSYRFEEDQRYAFFITGIPAVLAALLQYFLLSFIPFLVVPRGVMVHIIGPAHPFDIGGQIVAALPIIAWAVVFPLLGRLSVEIFRALQRRHGVEPPK